MPLRSLIENRTELRQYSMHSFSIKRYWYKPYDRINCFTKLNIKRYRYKTYDSISCLPKWRNLCWFLSYLGHPGSLRSFCSKVNSPSGLLGSLRGKVNNFYKYNCLENVPSRLFILQNSIQIGFIKKISVAYKKSFSRITSGIEQIQILSKSIPCLCKVGPISHHSLADGLFQRGEFFREWSHTLDKRGTKYIGQLVPVDGAGPVMIKGSVRHSRVRERVQVRVRA